MKLSKYMGRAVEYYTGELRFESGLVEKTFSTNVELDYEFYSGHIQCVAHFTPPFDRVVVNIPNELKDGVYETVDFGQHGITVVCIYNQVRLNDLKGKVRIKRDLQFAVDVDGEFPGSNVQLVGGHFEFNVQ